VLDDKLRYHLMIISKDSSSGTGSSPSGRDEDGDIEVSVSLGEIYSEGKKSWESDIGDCDNTRDGGKITGGGIAEDNLGYYFIAQKSQS
nr:hypothetical protein [Tanacetum cinerariifolium]